MMTDVTWTVAPWGRHAVVHSADDRAVKLLDVRIGGQLSVQQHKHRAEQWTVLSGRCEVAAWDGSLDTPHEYRTLGPDGRLTIPVGWTHTLKAVEDTVVLEVIEGRYDPEDIVRLADRYGR